jgi:predicted protein tyrosine phosphatase
LLTLIDPGTPVERPVSVSPDNHLRLDLHDIASEVPGHIHPSEHHIDELLRFVHRWEKSGPMLVHCWAGVSRSTAAAFIAMCTFSETGQETTIAKSLRQAAPYAQPNRALVSLADEALGRGGRMVEAVEAIGRGDFDSYPDEPVFSLDFSQPTRP